MDSTTIQLTRSLRTQAELNDFYGKPKDPPVSIKLKIKEKCNVRNAVKYLLNLIPIFNVLRNYKVGFIVNDIISGLTAACLHFPQGLAFGMLASLAPNYGLYTSFFPVLLYVIFGTSQHVSFGTNAVIAIFTAELVDVKAESWLPPKTDGLNKSGLPYNMSTGAPNTDAALLEYKASVAAGSTCLVGILLLLMGLLRLGFITSYLSSSFIAAFTTTGGIHILSSQIPNALGIKIKRVNKPGKLIYMYIEIFKAFPKIHVPTLIVSIICLLILVVVKDIINEKFKDKMKMPIPIDIILVVIATIISQFAKLEETYQIGVVGDIPSGLPSPGLPMISADLIGHSIVVGIIIFVLTISMAKLCEAKHNYTVDDNQELVAYGMSNLGSSFFWCFPSCVAPPRTVLLSTMNAKTTLNCLVSAGVVLLIILFIGPYLRAAPSSVLAIMIIVAVKNLLYQFNQLPTFWRLNRYDFVIFLGTVISGVGIDFPYALYVGIILCLLTSVIQTQRAPIYSIRKVQHEDRLLDTMLNDIPAENSEIAIFRMESTLYFATVDRFKKQLYKTTLNPKNYRISDKSLVDVAVNLSTKGNSNDDDEADTNDRKSLSNNEVDIGIPEVPLTHIIIDCSSINYIDMNGKKTLLQINSEFRAVGVTVVLADCTLYMKDFMERSGMTKEFGAENIYNDLLDAYLAISSLKK